MKKLRGKAARTSHSFEAQYLENLLGRSLKSKKGHIGEVRVENPFSSRATFHVPFSSVIEIEALVAAGIIVNGKKDLVRSALHAGVVERTIPIEALSPEIRRRLRVFQQAESHRIPASSVDYNKGRYHFVIPAAGNHQDLFRTFSKIDGVNLDAEGIKYTDIGGKKLRCTVPERSFDKLGATVAAQELALA